MSVDEFEASLSHASPPDGWSRALQALWWDAHDDWERAHGLVQMDEADRRCAWVHAYLHRKEGNLPNAAYWYRRSGHPVSTGSLTEERQSIARILLGVRSEEVVHPV
jgi:G3E family GTPase